jgi:hypothetical protein
MKRKSSGPRAGMPAVHAGLVRDLVGGLKPVRPVWSAWVQWLLWLLIAVATTAAALFWVLPEGALLSSLAAIPRSAFLVLTYLASAAAAWGAILSSLPGRTPGRWTRAITVVLLASLVALPLLFAPRSVSPGFSQMFRICCGCVYVGAVVGIAPWLGLGWMLSRNASFHPGWTGAWAGVSAFLLGLGVAQIHCAIWEMDHVMMGHLLPVGVMTAVASVIGAFWFSRWKQ